MLLLLALSTIITLAAVLPRSVYSPTKRELCGFCRYDLSGLSIPGLCPECGKWNSETTVLRTSWIMRWKNWRFFTIRLNSNLSARVKKSQWLRPMGCLVRLNNWKKKFSTLSSKCNSTIPCSRL